ncbi:MAG: PIN domain-containing protein [archaeon]
MKQVILDTNFILTCIKQKIDFFEQIPSRGIQIIIPKQVINEIRNLKNPNTEFSLKLLEKNKFKKIDIGKGHVDKRIILYANKHPNTIIATLDKEIKNKVKNNKLVIRGKKKLEVV